MVRSLRPGWQRPRSRRELMRAFHSEPELREIRADHRANVIATMRFLARSASWADSDPDPRATCRPTRARVAAALEYSISTWKAVRRLLQAWGWLVLLRAGRSEQARRESEREELQYAGNDAAVFMVVIPRSAPRSKTRPAPAAPSASALSRPPTPSDVYARSTPAPPVDGGRQEPGRGTALRADSLARPACWLALQDHPVLKKLSERAAVRLWRPFEARGWSVAEWRRAFLCQPDGTEWARRPSEVRWPASWAASRLRHWRERDSSPMPAPSMLAAVARQADRAASVPLRAARRTPGADPGPHADQLREQMSWPDRPPAGGRQPQDEDT